MKFLKDEKFYLRAIIVMFMLLAAAFIYSDYNHKQWHKDYEKARKPELKINGVSAEFKYGQVIIFAIDTTYIIELEQVKWLK